VDISVQLSQLTRGAKLGKNRRYASTVGNTSAAGGFVDTVNMKPEAGIFKVRTRCALACYPGR
jgi:hypothetical protein